MLIPDRLLPGDLILFKPGKFDPLGRAICIEERDTEICHAALVGENNMLWTTGALRSWKTGFLKLCFGPTPMAAYLRGRKYFVVRRNEPMSTTQRASLFNVCEFMTGQPYGFYKLAKLITLSHLKGFIRLQHDKPYIDFSTPFCSEAVANAFWRIGFKICGSMGKLEPAAIAPASIYTWSRYKETDFNVVSWPDEDAALFKPT